jgi:hypothetical protein
MGRPTLSGIAGASTAHAVREHARCRVAYRVGRWIGFGTNPAAWVVAWRRSTVAASAWALMETTGIGAAAKRCFRNLLKGRTYVPRVVIMDKLKSYGAALRNAFSRRTDPSPNTSARDATGSPLLNIASRWCNNSRRGGRLRVWLSLRNRRVACHPLASLPSDRLKTR